MKTITKVLTLYILATINVFSQGKTELLTDSSLFIGRVIKKTMLKSRPSDSSSDEIKELSKEDNVFIFAVYLSDNKYSSKRYYGVFYDADSGFVDVDDIFFPENQKNYVLNNANTIELRRINSHIYSLMNIKIKAADNDKLYAKYDKIGLVITEIKYAFAEVGSQFGLTFSFYNGYNKDIKYINFFTRPYNRLGDITRDNLGRDKASGRIIGPLKRKAESTVTFDELYWDDNNIINCVKVVNLKVTFMDGTIKEIIDLKNHLGAGVTNSCK